MSEMPRPHVAAPLLQARQPRVLARGRSPALGGIEAALDPVMAVLTLWGLAGWQEGALRPAYMVLALIVFSLSFPGSSQLGSSLGQMLFNLGWGWAWRVALLLLMGISTQFLNVFSVPVLLHWLWLAPVAQVGAHLLLRRAGPQLAKLRGSPPKAVIVGFNAQGASLAQRLRDADYAGIDLLGFFDDRSAERRSQVPGQQQGHRLIGGLQELSAYVKTHGVQLIYLSLPMASRPRILAVLDALKDTTASIYFVPDMFITDLIQGRSDSVCGVTVISVCDTPFRDSAGLIKRLSDVLLASVILLLISPVMLLIALLIKLDSPGPVIFSQRRYGLDGQQIWIYKFRSMAVAEDGEHISQATRGDARITRLGALLRRTSLDELPQFLNVLQGRMSVVGPRPHAVAHNELYRQLIKGYMVRHKVRPGVTGWAQVNGQRGETDTLDKMQARIDFDLDYLRHWSLRLDFLIILKTIKLVFKDSHAY
jgi:putative colanic acid biosysnthesis UDP-glucose lipid carrier transferase